MATAPTRTAPETTAPQAKTLRITVGTLGAGISLALAVSLALAPEWFGLSSSPALYEKVRAEGRGGAGIVVLWALIALPVAGLLQTPVALLRGARIGAGWALIAAYWLYEALLAVPVWLAQGLFPPTDGPGKSGGMYGAAVMMALATPVFAVCWGSVFRKVPGSAGSTLAEQVRTHVTAVALISFAFVGVFVGMMTGASFGFPDEGSFAMLLPGGIFWGFFAGAALGTLLGAALHPHPERRRMTAEAADMARTAASVLLCCLAVAQLGWVLPEWTVVLLGIVAPFVLMAQVGRLKRLERWLWFRQLEVPKGAFD